MCSRLRSATQNYIKLCSVGLELLHRFCLLIYCLLNTICINISICSAQKLRLCHPETGEAFKMDASLQALLSHTDCPLHNGGNVILEYLDNESSGLDDVTAYIPSS